MSTERPDEPTDLLLREATAEDAAEIAELYLAARRAAVPAMPPQVHTVSEVHDFVARTIGEKDVWVGESDGEILGYAVLTRTWLDGLYVGPASQGSGVGSALLDLAKARRPDGFSLWVFASNTPARGFYHRHGLLELEHTDGADNEEHAPDVRMAWPGTDPLSFLRRQIDEVDTQLGSLLERRLALTAAVQGHKQVAGHAGRDTAREQEIVDRLARLAPSFGPERLQRIVHAIIVESLDASSG